MGSTSVPRGDVTPILEACLHKGEYMTQKQEKKKPQSHISQPTCPCQSYASFYNSTVSTSVELHPDTARGNVNKDRTASLTPHALTT